MATSNGKVVGTRLPLTDYIALVAKAADLKMSVSDYILIKLYAPADPSAQPLQQARQQVDQLKAQVIALEADIAAISENNKKWQNYAKEIEQAQQDKTHKEQQEQRKKREEVSQQKNKINTLIQELNAERKGRMAAQDHLQNLRRTLAQVHNESSLLGKMSEKYWEIIDQFIPPANQ